MQTGYKIKDKDLKRAWLVISQDSFVGQENLKIILDIAKKNNIDNDSIINYAIKKPDFNQLLDESQTVGFFGSKLIVLKHYDLFDFNEEEIDLLTDIIENSQGVHFAFIFTLDDMKKATQKRFSKFYDVINEDGISLIINKIDDRFLEDLIMQRCKLNKTEISSKAVKFIINQTSKDIGMIINEIDKLCAASNYTEIDENLVDIMLSKTVEGSVFDIIDLICLKRTNKALEKLNILFDNKTDEILILSALSSSFIDMHRAKLAQNTGYDVNRLHKDFSSKSNVFRFQKAMGNQRKFTKEKLEDILKLLLKADLAFKSTSIDKKEHLSVLIARIIAT